MKRVNKLIREPIVLFFILGILLYFLYARSSGYIEEKNRRISVNQAQIAMLEETFIKTWNRSPSEEEMDAQINDFIMDEVFYREAVSLGLDKTDLAVKRRLRQIMEMMMDDYATIYPSEDKLQQYLSENPEKFRREDLISFRQLYFKMEEKEQADLFLTQLQQNENYIREYSGGLLMLPDRFEKQSRFEVERAFGEYFSNQLFLTETKNWQGPVKSPYGWHLVLVREITEGEVPELNDVWDEVELEWSVEQKKEIKQEQYRIMREQYRVNIEEK